MKKNRIDLLLVEKGFADSRSKAQRLVMAGQVRVNGQIVQKSSIMFTEDITISVDTGPRFVSRGGEKLQAALDGFQIAVEGMVCADVGASTGGFTDCLIQNGAKKVFAIDVGKGILHWNLRQNEKIVALEGVNARKLKYLPEEIDIATIDVSFISSKVLLPIVKDWFRKGRGQLILLIKPQFEAGKSDASRGKGVIRDPLVHQRVLSEVLEFAQGTGYQVSGLIKSPLLGPKGNIEFLAWFEYPLITGADIKQMIEPFCSKG
jgi:23S rRNA (cytidine1920-2'-O)/16S rRNA (cytidine1409-2'-O)-methyltransferase